MIRPFYDIPVLKEMLACEGLPESEMGFDSGMTYVLEDNKIIKGVYEEN